MRSVVSCARAFVLGSVCMVSGAHAQGYPDRPIRLVVGFAPGGQVDIIARKYAQQLSAQLGQPIVVENRSGADGLLASQQIARAEPNGYTLYLATSTHVINASLFANANYAPLADFTPIVLIGEIPNFIVAKAGADSLSQFISQAREKKGELNYATGSSVSYLSAARFNQAAKIDAQRIAYKGAAPALAGLLAGEVDYSVVNGIGPLLPHLQGGKISILAIAGSKRSSMVPTVPLASEAGLPGFTSVVWYGVLGPRHLPQEVVERIQTATHSVLSDASALEGFKAQGLEPNVMDSKKFTEFIRSETQQWKQLIKETAATPN